MKFHRYKYDLCIIPNKIDCQHIILVYAVCLIYIISSVAIVYQYFYDCVQRMDVELQKFKVDYYKAPANRPKHGKNA